MCQHYEHSAAESTIDLDSPHHRCREPGENLLLLRCDDRNHMLTPEGGRAFPSTGMADAATVNGLDDERDRRPSVQHRGRASSPPTTDSARNINLFKAAAQCPRPDSNRQPAD